MTDIEKRAIELWGGRLEPYPPGALDGVDVTPATRNFLLSIGMPRTSADSALMTLYPAPRPVQIRGEPFIQIGEDPGTVLCLKPGADAVWSVDTRGELPTVLVNSNIPTMLVFLALHQQQTKPLKWKASASERQFQKAARELKREFVQLDPPAMADRNTYWSEIVQQTSHGML